MVDLTPALPGFEPGARRGRRPQRIYSEAALERRRQYDRERDKQRPRIHGRAVAKLCERCGRSFAHKPSEQPRYCSRQCMGEAQRKRLQASRIYVRDCPCGKTFIARHKARIYCTNWYQCSGQSDHQQQRRCPCGALIGDQRRKCDRCRYIAHRARKKREKRKREAGKRGILHEPYTLAEIAERDGHRCRIPDCGKRVAMTKTVPHPKAPTIDHIIPISAGGDDVKSNVQLAHFSCNAKKHVGGSQQLRLIG